MLCCQYLGKDKLGFRSIPSVLLGYSPTQKGYILLNIQTGEIFVRRDISFKEHIFPFKHHRSEFQHSTSMPTSTDIAFDDALSTSYGLEQEHVISVEVILVFASDSVEINLDARHSAPAHHAPRLMSDYVMSCNSVNYSHVSASYACYLNKI